MATHHEGPYILGTQGDVISTIDIAGYHIDITTTIFSTWIAMGIIFLIASILMMALATDKFPKIREMGLHLISSLDTFVSDIFGDKGQARFFLPVLASIFLFVFIGNLSGLIFDYINFGIPALHAYLRPINSDLNTTIVLAL